MKRGGCLLSLSSSHLRHYCNAPSRDIEDRCFTTLGQSLHKQVFTSKFRKAVPGQHAKSSMRGQPRMHQHGRQSQVPGRHRSRRSQNQRKLTSSNPDSIRTALHSIQSLFWSFTNLAGYWPAGVT